jgi:RNA polymerase sigma factor (sigma-70 family)
VLHQVFCALARAGELERIGPEPMPYVYRAVTNRCLKELAARKVRLRPASTLQCASGSPAEAVHARDLLQKLAPRLDDLDRQILVLWVYDGLPQEEIAATLGVWRRTVGRRLARLRGWIEELERAPGEPGAPGDGR